MGVTPYTPTRSETGPRFTVGIKKIGSNRSSHSEFLTCIERWKKIMAQELTDEEMNQQMDQHESVTDEEMNQLMDQYEAVSMTCTPCKKVIFRTLTLIFFHRVTGIGYRKN